MALDWSRLTWHAKRAVVESQEFAASLGSSTVQPEHVLMTLLDDTGSAGILLLSLAGISIENVHGILEERLADADYDGAAATRPSYSGAVRTLVQEASGLAGSGAVGTEHLVLAALVGGTPLARALAEGGVELADVQGQLEILSHHELRGAAAEKGAAASAGRPAARPAPREPARSPVQTVDSPDSPSMVAERTPPVAGFSTSHTLSALGRLVVDLAGKAARAARDNGNTVLADQLDTMRKEAERELRGSAAGSVLGTAADLPGRRSA